MSYLNLSRYFEGEVCPKVAVSGHFILRRIHESGAVLQELKFDNLITDIGLDRIGYAGESGAWKSITNRAVVGTGTAVPTVQDTSLSNQAAVSTTTEGGVVGLFDQTVDRYSSRAVTFRFPFGTFSGTNLSEVGIGWSGGNPAGVSGSLFSRQLILDSNGTPTTITVLSNEALDVTYEIRLYPILSEFSGTLSFSGGGSYAYRGRAVGFSTYWSPAIMSSTIGRQAQSACLYLGSSTAGATATYPVDLNAGGGQPVGVGGSLTSYYTNSIGTVSQYSIGSFTSVSSTTVGTSDANFNSGIAALQLRNDMSQGGYRSPLQSRWTIIMDDKIPKTSLNTMQVVVSQSWGRK
jgi:hypothetical protein